MKLFSYDNPILSTLRRLADYFVLGLLWVAASVPVITGGAATTAALQTVKTSIRKDGGHIWQTFWRQFRAEFKQATILWLLMLALSGILFLNFCIIRDSDMPLVFEIVGYAACLMAFLWMQLWFGYLSSFEDDTKTLLHNTFRIAISSPGWTVLSGVLSFAAVIVAYISLFTISLLLFVIPACYLFVYFVLMNKLFSPYLSAEEKQALTETF
jgi:uncharacterized membrane protein YesL